MGFVVFETFGSKNGSTCHLCRGRISLTSTRNSICTWNFISGKKLQAWDHNYTSPLWSSVVPNSRISKILSFYCWDEPYLNIFMSKDENALPHLFLHLPFSILLNCCITNINFESFSLVEVASLPGLGNCAMSSQGAEFVAFMTIRLNISWCCLLSCLRCVLSYVLLRSFHG